jgi:hypothetical protein
MTGGEGLLEVSFVRVQKRRSNRFVTIPKDAIEELDIKDHERMKVYVDKKMRRVVYEAL